MDKAVIYIHGKGENAEEAIHYKPLFSDCDVIGLDYTSQFPWEAMTIRCCMRKLQNGGAELNNAPILPEHINCKGCRVDGIKTVFCDSLCGIRQCALKKDVTTCGDCPDMESCQTVGEIISNNPDALKNLRGRLHISLTTLKLSSTKLF